MIYVHYIYSVRKKVKTESIILDQSLKPYSYPIHQFLPNNVKKLGGTAKREQQEKIAPLQQVPVQEPTSTPQEKPQKEVENKEERTFKNWFKRFFGKAPDNGADLEW